MTPRTNKPPKHRCAANTKAGKRCQCAPLRGSDFCSAHDPTLPEESRFGSRTQAGIAGARPKPRTPGVIETMRAAVEERVDEVLAPYFDALREAVVTASYEGQVYPSEVPDLGARIAAAEKLLNRVYGMPRQATELTGAEGGPVALAALPDGELRTLAAALAAKREA